MLNDGGGRWWWWWLLVAGGGCRWRWPKVMVVADGGQRRWWPEGIFVINKRLEEMEFNSISFEKEWVNQQVKEFMELNSIP